MHRLNRYWKFLAESNRRILSSRYLATCGVHRPSSGLYSYQGHVLGSAVTCATKGRRFPIVIQCLNLAQDSRLKRIRRTVPDELWAILIVGIGGVLVFIATEYNKMKYGKNKPPELEYKLKMAKKKDVEGDKDQSIKLLKEALKLIHGYFERTKNNKPESTEQEKKDNIKTHKYLRYVLDQVRFELSCVFYAEHYFRLLLQDLLSSDIPKVSQGFKWGHELAAQGFQWATDTIQKKVNESPDVTENSKALLGVCLEGWGTYLLSQDKPTEASRLLTRALKISKEVLGEDHEQTTVVLNNLAKAYAESGKYELAEEMAREAVRIAEQTQNTHLSRFVANLGTILNLEGNVSKAKEALKKALKLADEAKDEETKELINDSLAEMEG
ncbi:unnamed protein product [Porites lobata]|uniref:Uncharacterized protein n=1 Tax=Porites lobata TaxID=104759 RepID=A0ABN8RFM0_9CNID|nr:unnamed protein product [Porites lobata]